MIGWKIMRKKVWVLVCKKCGEQSFNGEYTPDFDEKSDAREYYEENCDSDYGDFCGCEKEIKEKNDEV